MELTVTAFREKLVALLEAAENDVRKYQEQLSLLDTLLFGEKANRAVEKSSATGSIIRRRTRTPNIESHKDVNTNVGKLIRKTFLDMSLEDTFNVPKVVAMVQPKFSNISKDNLSKSASGIARRLEKSGKIKIVAKGSGRKPHTYQRVS